VEKHRFVSWPCFYHAPPAINRGPPLHRLRLNDGQCERLALWSSRVFGARIVVGVGPSGIAEDVI
jgi:hypothetical protein